MQNAKSIHDRLFFSAKRNPQLCTYEIRILLVFGMMNIGTEMAKKLTTVGIDSAEKLSETGSRQAFLKLKAAYPQLCLVHLYALEGAILNTEFNCLSETTKKELKEFSDFLKK